MESKQIKYTFIDTEGEFRIPEGSSFILLMNQVTNNDYKILRDVFVHVIKQHGEITVYLDSQSDFLPSCDFDLEEIAEDCELFKDKIKKGLVIINKYFIREYRLY